MFRQLRPFFILVGLFVLASLAMEHVNGRFWLNDFRVYYMAADNMRHGLPVYGEVFGEDTGLYKYAPVVLYFFLPYTFLSFYAAGVLHFLLIGVLLMACFVVIEKSLEHLTTDLTKVALRAILGLLCIAVLLVRELHMGNINMGLILLAVLGVERFIANQRKTAGILWGIVWLIKPYLLLMIVPLVIRREWRVLRTAGTTMLAGLLLPLLLQGPAAGWELTREWGHSMLYHTQVMASPDHLTAILCKYTGMAPSTGMDVFFIALLGLLLSVFTWRNIQREAMVPGSMMARSFELWMAMAIVPILVITDQQHFMFSLPLILYILAYLFSRRDLPVLVFFLLSMVLYGTRSSDLWGRALENKMVGWGVLGSGNILLMIVAWAVWRSWRWSGAKP